MNKTTLISLAILGSASAAMAGITFSGTPILNSGSGTIWDSGTLAVFVVDTNGDGFAAGTTNTLNVGESLAVGTTLGAADDVIFHSGATAGNNSTVAIVGGFSNISYPAGASLNDDWAIFVFDNELSGAGSIGTAGTYAMFTSQGGVGDWDLPSDGQTWTFGAGNDASAQFKQLTGVTGGALSIAAVPEPSTFAMLLGGLAMAFVGYKRRRS